MGQVGRRSFLKGGAGVAAGGALLGGPFQGFAAAAARPKGHAQPSFRELRPVPDLRDGEVRLHLPEGFQYRSFNPAGAELSDGVTTPPSHDGMAAFQGPDGNSILVRNHEINGPTGAFGDRDRAYDPMAPGGTVTLEVTPDGHVRHSEVSLNGTQMNCSGGPMPWGSWITCEETVNGYDVGDDFTGQDNQLLEGKHGYIFDVPSRDPDWIPDDILEDLPPWVAEEFFEDFEVPNPLTRKPIRRAGRFAHESAVFDPVTGAVYLTEDNFAFPSGFYRYIPPVDPRRVGRLLDGGRLQMLAVTGQPNAPLHEGQRRRATYDVSWVDIEDPNPNFTGIPPNDVAIQAVGNQGREKGAAIFSRLEGSAYDNGVVYFCSTQGGAQPEGEPAPAGFGNGRGQIWAYRTHPGKLQLLYESPTSQVLDLPDNTTVSPRGTLVLCEDGPDFNYLRGLTRGGQIFDFSRMVEIPEDPGAEFAGSTFGPDGRTLYVNVQSSVKGRSFAIWGPWHRVGF